jgi:hypothetical protein
VLPTCGLVPHRECQVWFAFAWLLLLVTLPGPIVPPPRYPETCAQVYVLDTMAQVANRLRISFGRDLKPDLLLELANMLAVENPFVQTVGRAVEETDPSYVLFIPATTEHSQQRRRYNRPTVQELAIFIPDIDARVRHRPRDLYVKIRGTRPRLLTMDDTHPCADPLQPGCSFCTIFFPHTKRTA